VYGRAGSSYHTSLPSDADKVEASMDQGSLTLRIPKAKEAQGHRIQVKRERAGGQGVRPLAGFLPDERRRVKPEHQRDQARSHRSCRV
jgi:hypothetical protein